MKMSKVNTESERAEYLNIGQRPMITSKSTNPKPLTPCKFSDDYEYRINI